MAEADDVGDAGEVEYGMVIDLDRCMGCRACMEACKVENNTTERMFWMNVFRYEEGEFPDVELKFLPRPCQHCDNAPCVKVCPSQARHEQDDGIILTDFNRCIGCRYCIVSCPYGVNSFNWNMPDDNYYWDWTDKGLQKVTGGAVPGWKNPDLDKRYGPDDKLVAGGGHFNGVTEKCTFCVHRVSKGLEPACVANCPMDALIFGNINDPESEVSQYLLDKPVFKLKEEFNTKPKVSYVGQMPPRPESRELEAIPTEPKKKGQRP